MQIRTQGKRVQFIRFEQGKMHLIGSVPLSVRTLDAVFELVPESTFRQPELKQLLDYLVEHDESERQREAVEALLSLPGQLEVGRRALARRLHKGPAVGMYDEPPAWAEGRYAEGRLEGFEPAAVLAGLDALREELLRHYPELVPPKKVRKARKVAEMGAGVVAGQ